MKDKKYCNIYILLLLIILLLTGIEDLIKPILFASKLIIKWSSGDQTRGWWVQFPVLGQSFPQSLVGPNSICRANAHMAYGLKHQDFTLHSITLFVLKTSAARPCVANAT